MWSGPGPGHDTLMNKNLPALGLASRRDFLRTAALAGVAAATGSMPGLSWAVDGDILRIRNYQDLAFLDPALTLSGAEGLIGNVIFSGLVRFTPGTGWGWRLDAAEYFEQVDPTHYAFRLRPGQLFNNDFGEITSEDVKYSLERLIRPDKNYPNAGDVGTLSHVEPIDRYSGVIVMKSPFAAFTLIGLCQATGSIQCKNALEAVGGEFSLEPPACSGPYQFKSWESKRKTVLDHNPGWTGAPQHFREIHVYAMTDEKPAELAYEAGELDCTQIAVESVEVFEKTPIADTQLEVLPALRYYWIGMNMEHPRLADIRVRRAVQWGIDVEAVLKAAWFGLAEPATGIIAPGLVGHREAADVPVRGDPEVARALLDEAGVQTPYRLTLACATDALEVTAGLVVQWCLKRIGIEVELKPQDNATLITMGMESAGERWKDVQLHLQSFFMLGDPYYATQWFIDEQVGVWNWERWRSKEFDRLHREALALTNGAERDPIYQRMQKLMEASGCYRFLTHGLEPTLIRDHIQPAFRGDGYAIIRDFKALGRYN